jgi:hypothetical protein
MHFANGVLKITVRSMNDVMKVFLGFVLFFSLGVAVRAQSKTAAGSICLAPFESPTSGEKSLANPAGGNRVSTYSIQVDKMSPVVLSNERPVRISSIGTGRKHLIKIIGDGKIVESFWFKFGEFKTKDLCLFFNSLYETWSLWDGKEGRAICKCKNPRRALNNSLDRSLPTIVFGTVSQVRRATKSDSINSEQPPNGHGINEH